MAGLSGWLEPADTGGIGIEKSGYEFGPDFVVRLADRWAEYGLDLLPFRSQTFHGIDRVFQHAAERAFPARMGGADHACMLIKKQDRAAVGGDHADGQSRLVGDYRIRFRPLTFIGAINDNCVRRMNLPGVGNDGRFGTKRCCSAAAILVHCFTVVGGADADIESAVQPF